MSDGAGAAFVHREPEAAPVGRCADAALLPEDDVPRPIDEFAHPFQVPLSPERRATLPLPGEDPVEDELRGDAGVVEARQKQRRTTMHPRVPDHQILDSGPLRVAEVQRAGHVRWRLNDHEGLLRGIGARAGTVRREHVRGQPALVDRALDRPRHVRLVEFPLRHRRPAPVPKNVEPARPADERVVVPPAGSGSGAERLIAAGHIQTPSWRAIGRRPHGSRATFRPSYLRGSHRLALAPWPTRPYSSRSPP